MRLLCLTCGELETNAYLLTASDRGEAWLIDAPPGVATAIAARLEEDRCRLVRVLLTHGHFDHMQDAARLQREGAEVWAHPADRILLERPEIMEAVVPGLRVEPVRLDRELVAGETLDCLGVPMEVRHVPGHCPGNVLFHIHRHRCAFVGDVIFAGSVGRTDLPGGDAAVLAKSIREQVYTLDDDTLLFPGHGPRTTVGVEKVSNPHVRAETVGAAGAVAARG